ncbi:MAG: hypothetical protein GY850_18210 [bacterium]|nr:hypothetical protein [bacterium]
MPKKLKKKKTITKIRLPFIRLSKRPSQNDKKPKRHVLHGYQSHLVRELVDSDGLTQSEVAKLLDHHKSWVSRRLLMIRHLAPPIIEDLKLALLLPGSAPALARLPSCNQSDFATAIQMHRLSVKQIRDLIQLWFKAADSQTKQFLLKSPIEALNIIQEETKQRKRFHSPHPSTIPRARKGKWTGARMRS